MKKARQIRNNEDSCEVITHAASDGIRLNKYISSSGYCSRREADRYIEGGHVMIDGITAGMGVKVLPEQIVCVNNNIIENKQKLIYLILHKPVGIICTTDQSIEHNIITYLDHPQRIFPIGRLDKDSSGLIILSNDGDVVNKILRSSHGHEKEYIVKVDKRITTTFIEELKKGVKIYNPVANAYQETKQCLAYQIDHTTFRIILSEGLNRQIRRMCLALGFHVVSLKRTRIMNIMLDGLQSGDWRYLSDKEIVTLNEQLKTSE